MHTIQSYGKSTTSFGALAKITPPLAPEGTNAFLFLGNYLDWLADYYSYSYFHIYDPCKHKIGLVQYDLPGGVTRTAPSTFQSLVHKQTKK